MNLIPSLLSISTRLAALPDPRCKKGMEKWKKVGDQFAQCASQLQQSSTSTDSLQSTRNLVQKTEMQLLNVPFTRKIWAVRVDLLALSKELSPNKKPLPEGVWRDQDGLMNISPHLSKERFYQVLHKTVVLNDVKIGEFTYSVSSIHYMFYFRHSPHPPMVELITPVSCHVRGGQIKLSVAQVRMLLAYDKSVQVPETLDFPYFDEKAFKQILELVLNSSDSLEDLRKLKSKSLSYETIWDLEMFLRQYRPSLLEMTGDFFTEELGVSNMIRIFPEDLALPPEAFVKKMQQLLDQAPVGRNIAIHFDSQTTYPMDRKVFLEMLTESNQDSIVSSEVYNFRNDRATRIPCNLSDQVISLSGLTVRILLNLGPREPLPESLDLKEIDPAYLPFLLKLHVQRPIMKKQELRDDEKHYLGLFLARVRPGSILPESSKWGSIYLSDIAGQLPANSIKNLLEILLIENPHAKTICLDKVYFSIEMVRSVLKDSQFETKMFFHLIVFF